MGGGNDDHERRWSLFSTLYSLAAPSVMHLYPLYASVMALESSNQVDEKQWLTYWILYSFLTLMEMLFKPVLAWIPIWYDIKLAIVAWLVLPQFRGATFIYERFVRQKLRQYGEDLISLKNKFMDKLVSPKKGEHAN